MGWYPIATAPKDGTVIRVRVKPDGVGIKYEPPYMLRWGAYHGVIGGVGWCYATTGAPVFSWHEPVEWTFDPFTIRERERFEAHERSAYGSALLPSQVYRSLREYPGVVA